MTEKAAEFWLEDAQSLSNQEWFPCLVGIIWRMNPKQREAFAAMLAKTATHIRALDLARCFAKHPGLMSGKSDDKSPNDGSNSDRWRN